jgi:hypothetical protein
MKYIIGVAISFVFSYGLSYAMHNAWDLPMWAFWLSLFMLWAIFTTIAIVIAKNI